MRVFVCSFTAILLQFYTLYHRVEVFNMITDDQMGSTLVSNSTMLTTSLDSWPLN
jgi:hypothetical protein